MCSCINELGEALGLECYLVVLWHLFDWATDIVFLEVNIYSPEFRSHPSFETTKNWAIIFDVLGFVFLVYSILQKTTIKLRIRKLKKKGAFSNQRQQLRFDKMGGLHLTLKWAILLMLCQDIPEAIITVHVIEATGNMSSTAWMAIITSFSSVFFSFVSLFMT